MFHRRRSAHGQQRTFADIVSCLLGGDRDAKLATSVRQSRVGNRRIAVAFAARSLISPLSHQIDADLNLDNTSILLIALPTLLSALRRVPMERAIAGIGSGLSMAGPVRLRWAFMACSPKNWRFAPKPQSDRRNQS
jgi:hypothetical protein